MAFPKDKAGRKWCQKRLHLMSGNNVIETKCGLLCRTCRDNSRRASWAAWARRNRKTPEPVKVTVKVASGGMPEPAYIAKGEWKAVVKRAALLPPGQHLQVILPEGFHWREQQTNIIESGRRLGLDVRVAIPARVVKVVVVGRRRQQKEN